MRNLKTLLFIGILLILVRNTYAQTNYTSKLHFEHFTIAEGLSQNNVTTIFQDSRGFLWIGTQAGLNCYDGKTFEMFKADPEDEFSISDNMIFGICEDKDNNIWVATENGLNVFNRKNHAFKSFYYNEEDIEHSISDNIVYTVFSDNEGSIWIKTPKSIDRININNYIVQKYSYEKDLFAKDINNYNHTIFQDDHGVIWFGTKEGLAYYEPEVDALVFFKHNSLNPSTISNNEIRCIYEDIDDNLWIGTSNGLNKFNRNTQTFSRSYYTDSKEESCITGITDGRNGSEIWISTNKNGIFRVLKNGMKYTQFVYSNSKNSIGSNETNCIFRDRSAILWIGTRNGLDKLDIKTKKFQILNLSNDVEKSFNIFTTAIYADSLYIYIGTKSNGLHIYNKRTNESNVFSKTKGNLDDNHITAIFPSYNGELYIAGETSISVYNRKDKSFTYLNSKYPSLNNFCSNNKRIRTVREDIFGNIWLGTNNGLFLYKKDSDTLLEFNKTTTAKNLPSNIINCIYEDLNDNIWIGTDKGLALYKQKTKKIEQFNYSKSINKHNNRNKVYTIIEDKQNQIWLGTNSGLYTFRLSDSLFHYYTEKSGLPNNQIFGLIEDGNDIWISTNKGLSVYSTITENFRHFDPSDGIQGYEFSPNCAYKTKNNELFFGGAQGINMFNNASIFDNPVTPFLELLQLTYYDSDKEKVKIYIGEENEITLPWQNNTVTIYFSAIEYTQPNKNQYKYKLEGLDEKWHEIGNQNSINFSSLSPGKYKLKIIGSNNDNVWGLERMLEITVTTPIWKKLWAYILYILIFGLALYLFIESRTKNLKKANKTLTEKQEAALEISQQKEELIVKNKNITDSITYAKRIQWAIMPSRAKFKQLLPNSFILYMPKDIVSGDFYWITEIEDRIFIAAVDCTGHGVPGAFMSIIGYDLLRNITKERKIFKPSEILDYLNKALIELLTKNEMEDDAVKDGMDMSICVLHKSKGILEYAGAFNPLYIIRNNKIISIKGDRFSVGLGNEHEDVPFKNHIIKIQRGDKFYLFSDGYADQFGGPKGKKMKYLRFRHLLLSINNLPYMKQARELKNQFVEWQGQLEQVDDILVLGFNVDNYLDKLKKKS